ncbi:MAG: trypsin-like peptidase domain-containing protein [Planctomycetia bacterium]|nr:trypsin-like peptidase domain-containing protein [Planctomycetia bacterium]
MNVKILLLFPTLLLCAAPWGVALEERLVASAEPDVSIEAILEAELPSDEERAALQSELEENLKILEAHQKVVKAAVKLTSPSVVHIEAQVALPSLRHGEERKVGETGSGVIVERNGNFYVLTNRHVLRNSPKELIFIKLHDGRFLHPETVWFDAETDIAVMRIRAPRLVPAKIGDSNQLEIGDFVIAIGSPFGLSHSVTYGIVSAKGRRALDIGDSNVHLQDFIQTDAAVNPGNSGGPLFNLRGEVIAINTAIASQSGKNEGIAFAIPIRMVMLVADQLIVYGRVRHGYLGVELDSSFSPEKARLLGMSRPLGARVNAIHPKSPADLANFSKDDVILHFNGELVEDDKHLYNLVNLAEIDKEIPVTVLRGGKIYKIQIFLKEK